MGPEESSCTVDPEDLGCLSADLPAQLTWDPWPQKEAEGLAALDQVASALACPYPGGGALSGAVQGVPPGNWGPADRRATCVPHLPAPGRA